MTRMTRKEKKLMYDLLLVFLVEKCGLSKSTEYEEAKQRIEMVKEERSLSHD